LRPTPGEIIFASVLHLEKWYGDVITPGGDGAIVYAARLHWGPLRVGYGAALTVTRGSAPTELATVGGVVLPRLEAEAASWTNASLRADARWCRDAGPIACRLVDGVDGAIHWTCHMPRAIARIQIGDTTLRGLGYLEQLELSLPPWKAPFWGSSLRWGRYSSPQHAVVWIEWTGAHARQWAWFDGTLQDGLDRLDGGWQLVLRESRVIRNRPLVATIGASIPILAARLPGALGAAHEHKYLSRAALVNGSGLVDEGWAIHEEVTW
jgi:hypothetical protein